MLRFDFDSGNPNPKFEHNYSISNHVCLLLDKKLISCVMTDHGPLIQDAPSKKYWNPARFAALGESAEEKGWAVCILNQPIENRGQFLKICEQGE